MRRLPLLLVPLALAGCSGGGKGGGFSSRGGEGAAGTLRLALSVAPTTLDPAIVQDVDTAPVLQQIYETLVDYDADSKLVPKLATKWSVEDGGKTYRFTLADAKFSNGRPLTSADVKASWLRALSPKVASPVASVYLGDIASIDTPDPKTVVAHLKAPGTAFLGKLTYPTAAVLSLAPGDDGGEIRRMEGAFGSGPFRFAVVDPNSEVRLEASPTFRGPAPALKTIRYTVIKDATTRLNTFKQGSLDILGIQRAEIASVQNDPATKPELRFIERPAIYYLLTNQRVWPPFAKPAMRRAFAMAVDRRRLAEQVLGGLEPATKWVPPSILPGDAGAIPPFDPAGARAELKAAGIDPATLPPLDLTYRSDQPDSRTVAEAVCADLVKNLGLKARPAALDWGTMLKRRNEARLALSFFSWIADYTDPQNFLSLLLRSDSSQNRDGWKDAGFDRLTGLADVETDPARRQALYLDAERIVVRELPRLPLYFGRDPYLVSPRVQGLRTNALGIMTHERTSVK